MKFALNLFRNFVDLSINQIEKQKMKKVCNEKNSKMQNLVVQIVIQINKDNYCGKKTKTFDQKHEFQKLNKNN